MDLVMNWKPPKGISSVPQMEEFFAGRGARISIVQHHRVPSGKVNTTFAGPDEEVNKVWSIVKRLEIEEIKNRKRKI